MKLVLTALVSLVCAFGAGHFTRSLRGGGDGAAHDAQHRVLALRTAAERVAAENARLAQEIARAEATLAAPPALQGAAGIDDDEIAAAVARWRAAHPEGERPAAGGRPVTDARTVPEDADIARVPMSELVTILSGEGLTNLERQELFERLRKAGRIDEYVEAVEALAAADPENADLQVALGHAYLQKLFGVDGAEAGIWAMKSDAAFDRALDIDDTNWDARFSKAVALSNWPAFMGRGPEAIENFELLLEQQADAPEPRPEYAMTYLILGNMYQAAGDGSRALATWKAGLELYPGFEDLRRAVELAGGGR